MGQLHVLAGIAAIAGATLYLSQRDAGPGPDVMARAAKVASERTTDPNAKRVITENVVAYTTGNQAIAEARRKAQATLPRFVAMHMDGKAGTYSVKFPLTQNGRTEHIWLQVSDIQHEVAIGRLANQPVNGTDYKMGQTMIVKLAEVGDWMVRAPDGIYGGYVAREQINDLPEDQRKAIKAQFID